MKANELMIGDWVLFGEVPVRIEEIEKVFVADTLHYHDGDVNVELYDPIPLTQEILKKNGWDLQIVRNEYRFYVRYFDSDINKSCDIRVYKEGLIFMILADINIPAKEIRMPIEYVHELQHAMRSLGVDKEIIL